MQPGWAFNNSTFCPHNMFMYAMWIWEQTVFISLYNINCLGFIDKTEKDYYAVSTETLNIVRLVSVFKGLMKAGA